MGTKGWLGHHPLHLGGGLAAPIWPDGGGSRCQGGGRTHPQLMGNGGGHQGGGRNHPQCGSAPAIMPQASEPKNLSVSSF
jgi:hypothetical protein